MTRIEQVFTAAATAETDAAVADALVAAEQAGRPLDAFAQSRAEHAIRGDAHGRLTVELDTMLDLLAGHLRERKAQERHRFADAVPRDPNTGIPLVDACPVCHAPAIGGGHGWLPHLVHEERIDGYEPCGCPAAGSPCVRAASHTGTCATDHDGVLAAVVCRRDDSTPHPGMA